MTSLRISRMAIAKLREAGGEPFVSLPERELSRKIKDAIAEPAHHRFAVTDIDHPDQITILHELTFEVRHVVSGNETMRELALNAIQRDGAIITLLGHNVVRNNLLGGRWVPCDMPNGKSKKPLEPKVDTATPMPMELAKPTETAPPLPPPEFAAALAGIIADVDQQPEWKFKTLIGVTPEVHEPEIELKTSPAVYVTPLGAIAQAAPAEASRSVIAAHEQLGAEIVDAEFEIAAAAVAISRAEERLARASKRRDLALDALVEAAQRAAKEPT